jgi:hypothetical protein
VYIIRYVCVQGGKISSMIYMENYSDIIYQIAGNYNSVLGGRLQFNSDHPYLTPTFIHECQSATLYKQPHSPALHGQCSTKRTAADDAARCCSCSLGYSTTRPSPKVRWMLRERDTVEESQQSWQSITYRQQTK